MRAILLALSVTGAYSAHKFVSSVTVPSARYPQGCCNRVQTGGTDHSTVSAETMETSARTRAHLGSMLLEQRQHQWPQDNMALAGVSIVSAETVRYRD
jgi:hypothetical protein